MISSSPSLLLLPPLGMGANSWIRGFRIGALRSSCDANRPRTSETTLDAPTPPTPPPPSNDIRCDADMVGSRSWGCDWTSRPAFDKPRPFGPDAAAVGALPPLTVDRRPATAAPGAALLTGLMPPPTRLIGSEGVRGWEWDGIRNSGVRVHSPPFSRACVCSPVVYVCIVSRCRRIFCCCCDGLSLWSALLCSVR